MLLRALGTALLLVTLMGGQSALGQRCTPQQLRDPVGVFADRFGESVAISGDTLVVGVLQDDGAGGTSQGSARVYRWAGFAWNLEAELTAADAAAGDQFGISVAISGDTIVVGAYADDTGATTSHGSAYVFVRSGNTWTQQAKLTASDLAAGDQFGYTVAIDGTTALIGSPFDRTGGGNVQTGSAYVFVRTPSGWSEQAKLLASDGALGDAFGISVSVSDDTAVAGAFFSDPGGILSRGSAYVFVRPPGGSTWSQQAKLTAADGDASDRFGNSVSVNGDTVVSGAPGDDIGAIADQGSAYVFTRAPGGSVWFEQAKLLAPDGAPGDNLGQSVVIDGDTVIACSYLDDRIAGIDHGSAHVYFRSGATWSHQAMLEAPDGQPEDFFGVAVALRGDTAVVGASFDDVDGVTAQGSAWVFNRMEGDWIHPDFKILATDVTPSNVFGLSLAMSGDTAVVRGSGGNDHMPQGAGAGYVFVRDGMGWKQQARITPSDLEDRDNFALSVAISGDTAVFGSPWDGPGLNTGTGSAYVYVRNGTTWTQQAKLVDPAAAEGDEFGGAVAVHGDTAFIGVARGSEGDDPGKVMIFARSGTNWSLQQTLTGDDNESSDGFGGGIAVSGDTLVVSAIRDDVGSNVDQGSVYVFVRVGENWVQQAKLVASDGSADDFFGLNAIDGDTIVVGAMGDDTLGTMEHGAAYVFVRSETTWSQQAKLTAPDGAAQDYFGTPAISGDLVVIGAIQAGPANEGSAYVFRRLGNTWVGLDEILGAGGAPFDALGYATWLQGHRLLVGVPFADVPPTNFGEGLVWSYDVPIDCYPIVQDEVLGDVYTSLDYAIGTGGSGHLAANPAAFHSIGIDTDYRTFYITSTGHIRMPRQTSLSFSTHTDSSLTAAPGEPIEIYGGIEVRDGTLEVSATRIFFGDSAGLGMPTASLTLIAGDFDCAINTHTAFLVQQGTLTLDQSGGEQSFEVMSEDIGSDDAGLDHTLPRHFPIGTLHIAAGVTVRLVDKHDNDGRGQQSCEALYVDHLQIDPGATLDNTNCRVYYTTLTNSGTVQISANLISLAPCEADYDGNGSREVPDIFAFLTDWFNNVPAAYEFGGEPGVPAIFAFLTAWFAGCP